MGHKTKEARKAYEAIHREEIRAYQKRYDLENKERKKAWRKKHQEENKEMYVVRQRGYRDKHKDVWLQKRRAHSRTINGRHNSLRHALRRDGITETDLLWNFNFYSALIQDSECHYCSGPLCETGGGLDRIENGIGHTCYNVVPCCRKCNRIKGHDTSYEEMMLLVPALRQIIKLKSLRQYDPSLDESSTMCCSIKAFGRGN